MQTRLSGRIAVAIAFALPAGIASAQGWRPERNVELTMTELGLVRQ